VAFLNVQVFPGEPSPTLHEGVPVYNIAESEELMSRPGWNEIYSIRTTGLFVVTTDHLVYRLEVTTADEVYETVRKLCNKLQPLDEQDARLLDVRQDEQAGGLRLSVQNYSRQPMQALHVSVRRGADVIASADFRGSAAPLEARTIPVPLNDISGMIEVTVTVAGDMNPLNNSWSGQLLPDGSQSVAAGGLLR
jgi:hypothetical protein